MVELNIAAMAIHEGIDESGNFSIASSACAESLSVGLVELPGRSSFPIATDGMLPPPAVDSNEEEGREADHYHPVSYGRKTIDSSPVAFSGGCRLSTTEQSAGLISQVPHKLAVPQQPGMIWFVFGVFFFLEVAVNYDSGAIPALLVVLKKEFNMTDVEQGLLGALPYIGLLICSPILGRGLQKYSPKSLLLCTMTGNFLSTVMLSCSYSSWMLFASRLLIGMTQSAFSLYAPVWIYEFAPSNKISLLLGLIQGGVVLGTMLGYLLAGFFRRAERDWRWAICIQCISLFILIIIVAATPVVFIDVHPSSSDLFLYFKDTQNGTDDSPPRLGCPQPGVSRNASYENSDDKDASADGTLQFHGSSPADEQVLPIGFPNAIDPLCADEIHELGTCGTAALSSSMQCAEITQTDSHNPSSRDDSDIFLQILGEGSLPKALAAEYGSKHSDSKDSLVASPEVTQAKVHSQNILKVPTSHSKDCRENIQSDCCNSVCFDFIPSPTSPWATPLSSPNSGLATMDSNCTSQCGNILPKGDNIRIPGTVDRSCSKTSETENSQNLNTFAMDKLDSGRTLPQGSDWRVSSISGTTQPRSGGLLPFTVTPVAGHSFSSSLEIRLRSACGTPHHFPTLLNASTNVMTLEDLCAEAVDDNSELLNSTEQRHATETMGTCAPAALNAHSIPGAELHSRHIRGLDMDGCERIVPEEANRNSSTKRESRTSPVFSKRSNPNTRETLKRLRKSPVYVWVTVALSALFFEVTGIQFWCTRFFEEIMQIDTSVVLVAFSATAASAPIAGVLLGGCLVDKLGGFKTDTGKLRTLQLCLILATLCCIFGIFASIIKSFSGVIACIWMILFLGGGILPAATGMILAVVDVDIRVFASGLSMTMYNTFGYVLGTFLPGALMQVLGLYNGMRLIFGWSIFGFLGILISLIFTWRLQSRQQSAAVKG